MYLGRLTNGERILLDRRRRGETQAQAAKRHCVSISVLGAWERGEMAHVKPPYVYLKKTALYERCLVARLRSGIGQGEVAQALKLSVHWLGRMERGEIDCSRLAAYHEIR